MKRSYQILLSADDDSQNLFVRIICMQDDTQAIAAACANRASQLAQVILACLKNHGAVVVESVHGVN